MTNIQVAVTGYGILGPLGRGPETNTQALREGRSGIVSQRPEWEEKGLRSHVGGKVPTDGLREMFDRRRSRFLSECGLLGAVAFDDAIRHAGLTEKEVQDPRAGVILGSGAGASVLELLAMADRMEKRGGAKVGPYQVPLIMGSTLTANIGSLYHIHGHAYSVSSACSTSAHAIMIGLDLIRSGRQDRVFAGGAEDVNVVSAASFDGMHALSTAYNDTPEKASRPFDRGRDGFVFAGGAAVVVLERLDLARARGAKIFAILLGAAATCDGDDMVQPNQQGGESVMTLALRDGGVSPGDIDYINVHGTSTPIGDVNEVRAIQAVFGSKVPRFSSTKSMTGHGLGAAGAQEAVYCLAMMNDKFLAPNINLEDPEPIVQDLPVVRETEEFEAGVVLSNSFGFGGTNCALVFGRPDR